MQQVIQMPFFKFKLFKGRIASSTASLATFSIHILTSNKGHLCKEWKYMYRFFIIFHPLQRVVLQYSKHSFFKTINILEDIVQCMKCMTK